MPIEAYIVRKYKSGVHGKFFGNQHFQEWICISCWGMFA